VYIGGKKDLGLGCHREKGGVNKDRETYQRIAKGSGKKYRSSGKWMRRKNSETVTLR